MKKPIVLSMWALAALLAMARAQTPVHWERSFGGTDADSGSVAATTRDGGYILGGYSYSEISGAKETSHQGGGDFWIVKLNSNGAKQWDASFGGDNYEGIHALQQTADGGYILGGVSFSGLSGNKSTVQHGDGDFWIVKVDSSGNKQWDRALGGSSHDILRAVQQTIDGGYILGGVSASPVSGNKTSVNYGATDYWIVKLDPAGNKQWERSLGGSEADELQTVRQTGDGGYILCGNSTSPASGNKASGVYGEASDGWVVKLDANGQTQWEQCLGGDEADELCSALQTSDGGYIVGGTSDSTVSANKSAEGIGGRDYWIVKLDAAGRREWDRSYGGDDADELHSVHQTGDGGYVVGGLSSSRVSGNKSSDSGATGSPGYWMLKLDPAGQKQWEQSFSGSFATGTLQLQSGPGGYVLAGLPSPASSDLDSIITKFGTPLLLHSLSAAPNRAFQARADGTPGAVYALEASPDFVNWTTVLTSTATAEGIVTFVGSSPANMPKLFFRARKQP
jgi:hypothetical protein